MGISGCVQPVSIDTSVPDDPSTTTTVSAPPTSLATTTTVRREVGRDVSDLSLPDVTNAGDPFRFVAEDDGALAVYFGYTTCPDVCPTTMADLRTAMGLLGDDAERVTVAMITVDPERDSAEVIADYVGWFIPGSHALRTEDSERLETVGDAFGADFGVTKTPNGRYIAFHTPFLYGVDDTGTIQAVWTFGAEPEVIAADLRRILDS